MPEKIIKDIEVTKRTIDKVEWDLQSARLREDMDSIRRLSNALKDLQNHLDLLENGNCKYKTIFNNVMSCPTRQSLKD